MGFAEEKPWRKMTRLILPVVVCLVVAVVGDSSAQDNTQVAAIPSGDVSQHSLVKREAKERGKRKGKGRRRRVNSQRKLRKKPIKRAGSKRGTGRAKEISRKKAKPEKKPKREEGRRRASRRT